MNITQHFKNEGLIRPELIKRYLVTAILLLLWQVLPTIIHSLDATAGSIDPSIWMLLLLGLIAFLLLTALSWILLQWFWKGLGLPALSAMVIPFRLLELWQQLSFFWASFALLLLAGAMCLIAIC